MPKNGKSKEKNTITPKAVGDVRYYNGDRVDETLTSTLSGRAVSDFSFCRTTPSTNFMPVGLSDLEKKGMLLTTIEDWNNKTGSQTFFSNEGLLFRRSIKNAGSMRGEWVEIGGRSNNSYMKKPEADKLPNEYGARNDANELRQYSGWMQTNHKTKNLPSQIQTNPTQQSEIEERWGTLLIIVENPDNSVTQVFYGFHKKARGRMFIRNYGKNSQSNKEWSSWREFNPHEMFKYPTDNIIQRVDKTTPNGYYKTNSSTQGLPQGKAGDGFVKVVKEGTHGIVTYTHIADNKVYTATYDTTTRSSNDLDWDKVGGTDGHTKIHDTRDQNEILPNTYKQHTNKNNTGYIVYEWKWADHINLRSKLTANKDVLLKTIIPEPSSVVGSDLICQQAYVIADHKWYYRKAISRDGNQWSQWEDDPTFGFRQPERDIIKDANIVLYSGVYKTVNNGVPTDNLPSEASNHRDGFLTHYKFDNNQQSAVQYWQTFTGDAKGKLFTRYKEGSQNWSNWVQLGTGESTPTDLSNYWNKDNTYSRTQMDDRYVRQSGKDHTLKFANLNSITNGVTGFYETEPNTENTPINRYNGYGVLELVYQNTTNKTSLQRWTALTGSEKGKSWVRTREDNSYTPWKELTATGGGSTITQSQVREWIKEEIKNIFNQFHTP